MSDGKLENNEKLLRAAEECIISALRAGGRGEKTKSLLQEAAASLALAVPGTDKDSEETLALMRAALTALEDSARVMEAGDQLLSIDGKVKVRIKVAEILNSDGTVLGTYQDRTCIILFPSPRFVMPGDEYLCIDSGTGELKGLPVRRFTAAAPSHLEEARIVARITTTSGDFYARPEQPCYAVNSAFLVPQDSGAADGSLVVVTLKSRVPEKTGSVSFYPGTVSEVIGDANNTSAQVTKAMMVYGLPHVFPEAVEDQIRRWSDEVLESDKKGRRDIREIPLVTVDGEDSRDFDDAVCASREADGSYRLYVAIADVSHYVRIGTPLDQEAYERGNSVYFPDTVIPMLPEKLSNGLCSLNPNVDRLCMCCEMKVSRKGIIKSYEFYPAVMRSHARLTYTKVFAMIEGDQALREEYKDVVQSIDDLYELYKAFTVQRKARGAISFEGDEVKFIFNADRKIDDIVPVERNDAHKLIEECMVAANVCAARFIEDRHAQSLFRVHAGPSGEKLQLFRNFLAPLGLTLGGDENPTPSDYQKLAQEAEKRADKDIISAMMLRSLSQAVYSPDNIGHFGLALKHYSHFTSPIRRYPDLVLHRGIKYLLSHPLSGQRWDAMGGYSYQHEQLAGIAEHCSETERRADQATGDVAYWLKCFFLESHMQDTFEATVTNVAKFGVFSSIDKWHIDGMTHVSQLGGEFFTFDPDRQILVGRVSRSVFQLGDHVTVKVTEIDPDEKKISFEILENHTDVEERRHHPLKKKPGDARGHERFQGRRQDSSAPAEAEGGRSDSPREAPRSITPESVGSDAFDVGDLSS